LPGIFRGLKLKPSQTVLDIPCGKGGVSIPFAKKYGVRVFGYDIVEGYVKYASSLDKKHGVGNQCTFKGEDIRKTTKRKNVCDLLLWIAPPHLWKISKETIKALRNCIENSGQILIADAYLYNPTEKYEDYETLDSANQGYTTFGDKIIRFIDYKDTQWKEDYNRARKSAEEALKRIKYAHDKKIVSSYLKSLDADEISDTNYMGLGIWIIRINQ
jgi:SAM-dependent methyltransferase